MVLGRCAFFGRYPWTLLCKWSILALMNRLGFLVFCVAWIVCGQSPSDLSRVVPGTTAPDFELPSASGRTLKLSSLRGKTVVLVFYRGYW